ncbi:AraC family transcriptional regulator [Salinivibrio sp. MA351]|uniref:AraC family transcriptional regulator n=1 Tax=unclassified Salinivibrio TaxID=2636825 RepID=UPI000988DB36|nr:MULTISPECIES: helix-turn-helix transcriptional regulator [unclassified Salinivibrio]NUY55773.1 helix-turn-helix transcriptional regulator [Salinivibrio sp. EAGSL]OOE96874.1 AraC family transcriptional regulator [Salinivibrio sp. MA351]
MAWLNSDDNFDPDMLDNSVLGIGADLTSHDSGFHYHQKGQLLFSQHGCMRITLANSVSILPPTRVAWIPGQCKHRVEMQHTVGYRSIYFDQRVITQLPTQLMILTTTPLLTEVLERIALSSFTTDWQCGAPANLLAVCIDELTSAKEETMTLPLPADYRLSPLLEMDVLPPLKEAATRCGASEKTITRLFKKETGMSYQQWRQQWRIIKAIELLAAGKKQGDIAHRLHFASDSAFITFFRTMLGESPRTYMKMNHH